MLASHMLLVVVAVLKRPATDPAFDAIALWMVEMGSEIGGGKDPFGADIASGVIFFGMFGLEVDDEIVGPLSFEVATRAFDSGACALNSAMFS